MEFIIKQYCLSSSIALKCTVKGPIGYTCISATAWNYHKRRLVDCSVWIRYKSTQTVERKWFVVRV